MKFRRRNIAYVVLLAVAFVMFTGLTISMFGQETTQQTMGLPDDWTHHHLVFSDPGTEEDAIGNGKQDDWVKFVNNPRYVMQQLKWRAPARGPAAEYVDRMNELSRAQPADASDEPSGGPSQDLFKILRRPRPVRQRPIHGDWSMGLGGYVGAGQYPAKFSFSTTSAGLCSNSGTPDFVVYPTGKAGSTTQANIMAYDNLYSGCPSAGGSSTVPLVYWSYYTGTGTVATSPVISVDGTKVAFIESGSSNSTLRISKWATGSGNGTNYGAPANITSTDNHTNAYAGASGNTAWSSCTSSPCMISVPFQTQKNTDITSAPWYDYNSDTLYVGDDGGYLHQFTGVFKGTPGESTNQGGTCGTKCVWPVNIDYNLPPLPLTGPVFDDTHSLIFVGIGGGAGTLASVSSTTGVISFSNTLDYATDYVSIDDAPLVDPSAGSGGEVYAFVATTASSCANSVVQFAEGSINGSSGNAGTFGSAGSCSGTITSPIYDGTFDNAYFTSSNAASPSGFLWVCANTGGSPTLYAVKISSNSLSTVTTGPVVSNSGGSTCSPVTEFCTNGGSNCSSGSDTTGSTQKDYIFVSPQTQSTSAVSDCTASKGCVLSYTIATTPSATLSGGGTFAGGASGMIVDTQNTTVSGALQLYFGTLASGSCAGNGTVGSSTGGCGVQASQSNPSNP